MHLLVILPAEVAHLAARVLAAGATPVIDLTCGDTADIRKVTYRNKEQSNIMAFASNQQAAIDSFKQECAQKGHETPYIEL